MKEITFVNKFTGEIEAIAPMDANLDKLIKIQIEEYDRIPLEEYETTKRIQSSRN